MSENGVFIVSAVTVVACWALTVAGLHIYRQIQRYVLVPGLMISILTIIGLLLANLGTNFSRDFDRFQSPALTTGQVAAAGPRRLPPVGGSLSHTLI